MFGSLSKGNRQKVMLAQAFLEPVDLLVLDEPVSGLDGEAVQAFSELIREACSDGAAVLASGHEANRFIGMDRVIRIENGALVETPVPTTASRGTPDRLIHLTATAGAYPAERISMLPGVRGLRADPAGRSLTLVTDRLSADAVLVQAIGLGWSVSLVSDLPDEEWRP
jgi:ABC-type multidrug transport system ATPase subunit